MGRQRPRTGARLMRPELLVTWVDGGRWPKCTPHPDYPHGKDIDASMGQEPACQTALPYPAKRCGHYRVVCARCGITAVVTTAGRPDDPRSFKVACRLVRA